MKKGVTKVFKCDNSVNVYQTAQRPDIVYKQYVYSEDGDLSIKEFREKREKLVTMKNRKEWPDFLIRPSEVGRLGAKSFTAGFPFVEGDTLAKYLKENELDLLTCAKLIKKLEDSIYSEKDFVFTDLANPANIVVLPNEDNSDMGS